MTFPVHVMTDLETMGTSSNAAVVAIGAIKFDPTAEPGKFISEFYETINLQSALDFGLEVDGSTVQWWLKQSDDARNSLTFRSMLDLVLWSFSTWFGAESMPIWGNGASFDCVVLGNAFRRCKIDVPWKYYDEYCVRTLRRMFPNVPRIEPVVAHHALHDAKAQAHHVQMIYGYLRSQKIVA